MIGARDVMTERPTRDDLFVTDFVTIFAHMWYRDFPLQHSVREKARRADWTTHIGGVVRSTADLMDLFTHFESGGRTDAELHDQSGVVALLEWEWLSLHRGPKIVNEFGKLKARCSAPRCNQIRFACLIGYARDTSARRKGDYTERTAAVLERYQQEWPVDGPPLVLVAIHFEWTGKHSERQARQFTAITIDEICKGRINRLREQPAYPWMVPGTRWACAEVRDDS